MKTPGFAMEKIRTPIQCFRVWRLYRRAFPANERKPFALILSMWKRGKTDLWYARMDGRFAGFAATVNGDGLILLDYIAVREELRGMGCGTLLLQGLMERYGDAGLFVEIESSFEAAENRSERLRRRSFYLRAGMHPLGVLADVFGVRMELLGWNCSMDFEDYQGFYRENLGDYAARHILEVRDLH